MNDAELSEELNHDWDGTVLFPEGESDLEWMLRIIEEERAKANA